MLFMGYTYIILWFNVFDIDIRNKDLAIALIATDFILMMIGITIFCRKQIKKG